ncbi:hypothetical protein JCM6882_006749 [Rhodosporidiobolus microsporus]
MFGVNRLPPLRKSNTRSSSSTPSKQPRVPLPSEEPLQFPGASPSPRRDWGVYKDADMATGPSEAGSVVFSSKHLRSGSLDGDRFIPTRSPASPAAFQLLPQPSPPVPQKRREKRRRPLMEGSVNTAEDPASSRFERVLRNELMPTPTKRPRPVSSTPTPRTASPPSSVFSFFPSSRPKPDNCLLNSSPLSFDSLGELANSRVEPRLVDKVPLKVLDAPDVRDDFYTQYLSWSPDNRLAIALGSQVWTYQPADGAIGRVRSPSAANSDLPVASVRWLDKNSLALGSRKGFIEIWDVAAERCIRTLYGHDAQVGTLDFSSSKVLTSGSHDKTIQHHDLRTPEHLISKATVHNGTVCIVKWSSSGQLATGGNDDHVCLFDGIGTAPVFRLRKPHKAAIVQVWKYGASSQPTRCIASLYPQSYRVLHLAISPDGCSVASVASDEILRFWDVFPSAPTSRPPPASILDPTTLIR